MANAADTITASVRETVPGTTNATPAFTLLETNSFDWKADSSSLASEITRANRAAGDSVEGQFYGTGSFTSDLRRDTGLDQWIESGLGAVFATNIAKAGASDLYQTLEQTIVGTAPMYFRANRVMATSIGFAVDATAKATFSCDFMGNSPVGGSAKVTGATYIAPTQGPILSGGGLGSITIAGLTASFYSLDLRVTHQRSPKFRLFDANAFGFTTSGNRQTTLTLTLYRDDLSPETVFASNTPVAINFALGGTGASYGFSLPRCFATRPTREVTDNNELVTIELLAVNDATLGSDISITKA